MKNLSILLISLISLLSFSNSLPHFIFDGIQSNHDCIEGKDKISFTIYGSLSEEINPEKMIVPNYLIEDMGEFKCSLLNNEDKENEKRTHEIVCTIEGSFLIQGYILDEPIVYGFDFNDENGQTTWPEEFERKIFLIGECGEKKEIDNEPILLGASDDFVSPIKNVRKPIISKALKNLPARTSVSKDEMKYQMKLTKNKFELSQVETAYMIYRWEAENIAYDCYNYYHDSRNLDYSEDGAYTKGKGVCNSYSKLFESFGKYLGLDVAFIVGYAKGASYVQGKIPQKTNHAWNAVKIGNSYYLLDATWGAGSCSGDKYTPKLRDSYFCSNPYGFIRSHLPPEQKWQLISPTITIQEFVNMMDISPEFFDLGFKSVTPDKVGEITTKGKFTSRITYKSKINLLLNLYYINNGKQEIRWNICSANYQSTYVDITCNLNQVGKYKFNIWADINGARTFLFAYDINYTK
jgi:hypothetical protein